MDIWADQWTDRRCVWERIGVFTFVGMKVCVYVCVCAQGSTELMILIGDPARSVVYLDEERKS